MTERLRSICENNFHRTKIPKRSKSLSNKKKNLSFRPYFCIFNNDKSLARNTTWVGALFPPLNVQRFKGQQQFVESYIFFSVFLVWFKLDLSSAHEWLCDEKIKILRSDANDFSYHRSCKRRKWSLIPLPHITMRAHRGTLLPLTHTSSFLYLILSVLTLFEW